MRDNKQTHLSSSSWRGCSREASSWSGRNRERQLKCTQSGRCFVWPHETRACQGHYHTKCVRVGGCARLTQLLRLLHHEELQVADCSHRWMKGCRGSGRDWGARSKRKLLVEVTILSVLFCCYFAHYYTTNLFYLDIWVLGWAYFQDSRFLKIHPPPTLSSHLTSSPIHYSSSSGTTPLCM